MQAYSELATNRPVGMGVGPIPEWCIQQYADRHDLGDMFVRQILLIDMDYVAAQAKQENSGHG